MTYKILIRGGAIAAGTGVNASYVHMLKQINKEWNIIDKSREKDNSFDAVWTYKEDIKPFQPDILLIHFGINDAYYPVYRSEFKENLVQLIRLIRKDFNTKVLLITSHPFDNIYDMQMINIYYRTIREVAVDLETDLLSLHTWFRGYCDDNKISLNSLVQSDTRYPNDEGQRLYGENIALKLKKMEKMEM